jgi:hypothetical protein
MYTAKSVCIIASGSSMIAERQQHVVDHAVVLQQADPGVDAQQERGPERQDDQHQQHVARRRRGARDGVGHRIADQQAQQGRDRTPP